MGNYVIKSIFIFDQIYRLIPSNLAITCSSGRNKCFCDLRWNTIQAQHDFMMEEHHFANINDEAKTIRAYSFSYYLPFSY